MKEDCLMAPLPVWSGIHVLPGLPDTDVELGKMLARLFLKANEKLFLEQLFLPHSGETPEAVAGGDLKNPSR